MRMRRLSTLLALLSVSMIATACFEDIVDDVGDEESGSGDGDGDTSGDGDASGDGDGDTNGDGDGDGDSDPFAAACELGCAHFESCAPDEFSATYTGVDGCVAGCASMFSGCVDEALAYFECFSGLACEQVVVAVTEGPDATACGPSYAAAQAACGN